MSRKNRYKPNTKYDEGAMRLYRFWNPTGPGFQSLKGKDKDYWRALWQTQDGFDRVLDHPLIKEGGGAL